MAIFKDKSTIQEARDQLFVDTADDIRLNTVGSNLGLDRPRSGVSDDKWRALIRKIALKPKLVIPIFHRILEICLGPRNTRNGTLSQNSPAGETSLFLEDADDFVQLGTLILDPALPTEEEIDFRFRSKRDKRIYLSGTTQFDHAAVVFGTGLITSSVSAGATSLVLRNSSELPTTGYPFSLVVGKDTENEEFVAVSNNNTDTNTLTISALVNNHVGPSSLFVNKELDESASVGRNFVILNNTEDLPYSGYIRLAFGTGNVEVHEYTDNQFDDSLLILKRPLQFTHAAGVSVDLVDPGTFVETASVVQTAVDWNVYTTEVGVVKVLIPADLQPIVLKDAARLHGTYTSASDTLSDNVGTTATTIPITNVQDFPEAGKILLNGSTEVSFNARAELPSEEESEDGPFALSNGQTLTISVDGGGAQTVTFNTGNFDDITDAQPYEVAAEIESDTTGLTAFTYNDKVVIRSDSGGTIQITGGTANTELGFPTITPSVILPRATGVAFTSGQSVAVSETLHTGDLPDGNLRNSAGTVITTGFTGPYLYDSTQTSITSTVTTLAAYIPPALEVVVDQDLGASCLEVKDAEYWPSPVTFDVEIGRDTGFDETQTVIDVTLQSSANTTVVSGASVGDFILMASDVTSFPSSSSSSIPAKYRILVASGTGNEEILYVNQIDSADTPDRFTLITAVSVNHSAGETVSLLNDVVTTLQLVEEHSAGHLVEPLTEEITLASTTGFSDDGGEVYFNFGKAMLNFRAKIVNVPASNQILLANTSTLPTTGYPYRIKVGEGTPKEEIVSVSNNNTGTNILTLSSNLLNSHAIGEYIEFISGTPEVAEYESVSGNDLVLSEPTVLQSRHIVGEYVNVSAGETIPDIEGNDYAFHLPPDFNDYLAELFDIVRAAGVDIEFIET